MINASRSRITTVASFDVAMPLTIPAARPLHPSIGTFDDRRKRADVLDTIDDKADDAIVVADEQNRSRLRAGRASDRAAARGRAP